MAKQPALAFAGPPIALSRTARGIGLCALAPGDRGEHAVGDGESGGEGGHHPALFRVFVPSCEIPGVWLCSGAHHTAAGAHVEAGGCARDGLTRRHEATKGRAIALRWPRFMLWAVHGAE